SYRISLLFFFFIATSPSVIYTLSLHDALPIFPLGRPPSYYEVAYITKSLFDCDTTTLEYVLENGIYPANFYIYRTNGTLLFQREDRKSTRLNSSHRTISYAVFCLKKKKKKKNN